MRVGVQSNAAELTARYRGRAARWSAALKAALTDVVLAVERASIDNTSGGGAAGDYPVPVRRGHLRRSHGSAVEDRLAMVFNTAAYAGAIQTGYQPYGNPNALPIPPREFLHDAGRSVDHLGIIRERMLGGLAAEDLLL